jgi:serine/threonine protein kinase
MEINYGSGGSANCVLVPPFNCKKRKYNNNYVSKIAKFTTKEEINLITNEIRIGKFLKNKKLDKYFVLVTDHCNLKKSKYKTLKKCNLDKKSNYKILYSKNVGCYPITKKSKVYVSNNNLIKKIKVNNIINNKIISKNKKYNSSNIKWICGEFTNELVVDMCFSESNQIKSIQSLLKMLKLLHQNNIIHGDIKLDNIISNNNQEIRLIDFGGASILSDFNILDINSDFNILIIKISHILLNHTIEYVSPELLIIYEFYKNKDIKKKEMFNNIQLILEKSFNKSLHKKTIMELKNIIDFIYKNKRRFIRDMFLLNKNSKIFKSDIYSMGMALFYIYKYIIGKQNINLKNKSLKQIMKLIYNMTHIDYRKRYNISKCCRIFSFK